MNDKIGETLRDKRWLIGTNVWGNPTDLRPILFYGYAKTHPKTFATIDPEVLHFDNDRISLIGALADGIVLGSYTDATKSKRAEALKSFVSWADSIGQPLSRKNLISHLLLFGKREVVIILKYAAARSLHLSVQEQIQLFGPLQPSEKRAVRGVSKDSWVIVARSRTRTFHHDFSRLVFPGDASIPISRFSQYRESRIRSAEADPSTRAELIRLLIDAYRSAQTAKTLAEETLNGSIAQLRSFVIWADAINLPIDSISAISALRAYNDHLMAKIRAGANSITHKKKIQQLLPVFCSALNIDLFTTKGTFRQPRSGSSGLTSKRPNAEHLKIFCHTLHEIVNALPPEVVCNPILQPLSIIVGKTKYDLPSPFGIYRASAVDARPLNLPLIRLRIWAEMNRFIGITGINLSVAQDLTIGHWKSSRLDMRIHKKRANKIVSVNISENYSKHIDRHVDFLQKAAPANLDDDSPLFPGLYFSCGPSRALLARAQSGVSVPLRVCPLNPSQDKFSADWFKDNGLQTVGTRALRKAKAEWLFRRHRGDSLKVSQALGNTPQVAHRHYGGKGNLAVAMAEWSEFWTTQATTASIAPGQCVSPSRNQPFNKQPSGPCHTGACLVCDKYRGEDSLDYIYRLLSFQFLLCKRASGNETVPPLIDRIDRIVDNFLLKHPEASNTVDLFRAHVADDPHPRFEASIRIVEALSA